MDVVRITAEISARAYAWYPHMSQAEHDEYVATQVYIACGTDDCLAWMLVDGKARLTPDEAAEFVAAGARPEHAEDARIVLARVTTPGAYVTSWHGGREYVIRYDTGTNFFWVRPV